MSRILYEDPIGKDIVVTKNSVKVNLTLEELFEQEIQEIIKEELEIMKALKSEVKDE